MNNLGVDRISELQQVDEVHRYTARLTYRKSCN
jgi:hypothetical protein